MDISFEGALRFCGRHMLMAQDVSEVQPQDDSICINGPICHRDEESGDLEIVSKTHSYRLGSGRYRVRVRLTKKEIANLARIALSNEPLSQVVEWLSRCSTCESREAAERLETWRKRRELRRKAAQAV